MRNRLAKVGLTVIALHSGLVSALGMGELTLDSLLNQPFRAEIPLRDIGELNVDQIRVRLADATAFENAGVDRSQFLSNLQFKVELVGGGNGRIVVTSLSSVVEPYLDFIVEARWPNGKMIREYTVLLDLPVYADDSPSRAINLSNAAPAARQNVPVPASPPSPSQIREPGGSIGAVDRAPPTARSPAQQQDLPPAANPSEYRIQHHDTMWRIATTLRPSSYVTTQQTMLALAKKNPQAFVNGNVNQIKSGYVLRVPSEAEAREIDHQAAVKEIRLQAKEWRGEKVARAAKTKSTPDTASAASATPMAPQIDATAKTQAPAPEGTDEAVKFSLGGADDSDSANEVDALREQIREEQENLEKSKLENGAIQNRVVDMEKQIQTLQSLIALKNSQLAALQSGQQAPESLAMSTENIAALEAEAAVLTTAIDADAATSPDTAAEMSADTETAKQKIIDKPAAKSPAPLKPVVTETPLQVLQSWVSQNLILFLGLLLALLAALVLFVRGRRAAEEDADLAGFDDDLAAGESPASFASGGEFDPDSPRSASVAMPEEGDADVVFSAEDFDFDKLADDPAAEDALSASDDAAFEGQDSTSVDDGDAPAVDAVVAQTGDVVAEAEIYVAYGRYDQAASLLKTAIAQDPDNTELHLKLIDIYLDTRDQNNFEAAYQDLRALNDDDAIARVKESMSAIEGVSHWLSEDPSTSSDNTVEVGGPDGAARDQITDFDVGDDVDALSLDDQGLDFELDDALDDNTKLDADAADNAGVAIDTGSDTDTLESLDVDLADLDFDFDGDFGGASKEPSTLADDSSSVDVDSAEARNSEEIIPSPETVVEDEELDISFDGLEDVSLDDNALSELTSSPDDGDGLDDDIISFEDKDVPSLDFTDLEAKELESTEVDDLDFEDLELGAIDLDDDDIADTDLGDNTLGDSGLDGDVTDLNTSSDDLSVASDLASTEAPLTPELGDDEASGVTSDELSNDDSDSAELDLSEFDMDLPDTLDTSESPLDAAEDSEELDLELSDFDMPSELSSASEASSTADELDVDVDESFFLDDDLDVDDSAVPADDIELDSGLAAEKQEAPAEIPAVETPTPEAPVADADTVNIDDDAIDVEDLVFDEFDAGEDDAEGFDSLLDSESVATKLDLARAYIDMGDSEGAREMLEEVLHEGDAQQQADAQTLLDNIG